jgi:hypothetical protein
MHYILFVMLFTTPPADKGKEAWTFQNSTAMEFATADACKAAVDTMIAAVKDTDTLRLFGWCFPKGDTPALDEQRWKDLLSGLNKNVPDLKGVLPDGGVTPGPGVSKEKPPAIQRFKSY